MKDILVKSMHDYVLISLGEGKFTISERSKRKKEIIDGCAKELNDEYTIDDFQKESERIRSAISGNYFVENSGVRSKCVELIAEYMIENKIDTEAKLKSSEDSIVSYLDKNVPDYVDTVTLKSGEKLNVAFKFKEFMAQHVKELIVLAFGIAVRKMEEESYTKAYEDTKSEEQKNSEKNQFEVGKKINNPLLSDAKAIEERTKMQAILSALLNEGTKKIDEHVDNTIRTILNYALKLSVTNTSKVSTGEQDTIACIFAGQEKILKVFISRDFVSTYLSTLYAQKGSGIVDTLRKTGFVELAEIINTKPLHEVMAIVISCVASCMKCVSDAPEELNDIVTKVKLIPKFSTSVMDSKFKRGAYVQGIQVAELDEEAQKIALELADTSIEHMSESERAEFIEKMKAANARYKVNKMVTLEECAIEEVPSCESEDDYSDVSADIRKVKDVILSFYDIMFDMPIKMKRFSGIFIFGDGGSADNSGVMEVVCSTDGVGRLLTRSVPTSDLVHWITATYPYPIKSKLKVARHNQVPSVENIIEHGYNYYPTFIARYALGYVKNQKYSSWKKFRDNLEKDVIDRLYKIYKTDTTINGVHITGSEFFVAGSSKREMLVSAFVNSVMFLTGTYKERYGTAQIKYVCGTPHTLDVKEYYNINNAEIGLSNIGTANYKQVNDEYRTNILEMTYMEDKKTFYNRVSWAYQELGKAYGEGGLPNLNKDEPVIIGEALDGSLVEFSLGDNTKFVTTIFAGSRSGKGVTTLSILSALLASRIPVCYLDCKPDMANCFWTIENMGKEKGVPGVSYAYDLNASTKRFNRSPFEETQKLFGENSVLNTANVAAMLFIAKQFQLLMLMSRYKQKVLKDASRLVWIFDEINNVLNNFATGLGNLKSIYADTKITDEEKQYILSFLKFLNTLYVDTIKGNTESFGPSGFKFILIGQMPQQIYTSSGKLAPAIPTEPKNLNDTIGGDFIRAIAFAAENVHILGRGVNVTGGYGTAAYQKNVATEEENNALNNQRYFVMRKVRKNTDTERTEHILFKPYLTLNNSNILDGCWTGGLGVSAGYNGSVKGTPEEAEMLRTYKQNANSMWGPNTQLTSGVLDDPTVGTGIVDEGTGFFGLIKTYLNNDDVEVFKAICKPYAMFTKFLTDMDMLGEDSMTGYITIEDFLYDFSEKGFEIATYDNWVQMHKAWVANAGQKSKEGSEGSDYNFGGNIIPSEQIKAEAEAKAKLEEQQREIERAKLQVEEENRRKAEEAERQRIALEEEKARRLQEEQRRAELLQKVQEKKQELEFILNDVKLYGNASDIAKIDEELAKIDEYDRKITDIDIEVSEIDTSLVDTTSIKKLIEQLMRLLESKSDMLVEAKSQLEDLSANVEPLQTVFAIESSVEQELSQMPSVLAQVEASEVNPLEGSAGKAFECPEDFDEDLKDYYVADDYISRVNDAVDKIQSIYNVHRAGCNTLLNKLTNGPINRDEVKTIHRFALDLRNTLDKTLAPVYEKKDKIDQKVLSIEDSDLDVTEYPEEYDKLSEYQSNFYDLVDITELSGNIDKLIEDTNDLDKINTNIILFKTMCADAEQKLTRLWGIINKSNNKVNVNILKEDVKSLDIACANVKGCMDSISYADFHTPDYMREGYADIVDKVDNLKAKLQEIADAQQRDMDALQQQELEADRLADEVETNTQEGLRRQQDAIQQVNSMDTSVKVPTAEESSARMAEILRENGSSAVSDDVINVVGSSVDLDAAVQAATAMATQQVQTQGDNSVTANGDVPVAEDTMTGFADQKEDLSINLGAMSQSDMNAQQNDLDQHLQQQTAQASTGGQMGGPIFEDSTGIVDDMSVNLGPQRVQANPSVRMQTANEAQASRIVNNRAVVHNANYLAEYIKEAREELDDALTRKTNIGFIDKALALKDLKNRHKLLMKVIGEEVGWGSVTVLELRADMMVVNRKYTIPSTILGDEGYNFYDGILDFDDLLFRKATRMNCFVVDQEVSDLMVSSCGGDVYENMFVNIPTLQTIYLAGEKISRRNRGQSIQMAVKAEIERAERSGRGKNAFTESLFASGQLKNTPRNKALANSVVKRAAKTGGRVGSQRGFSTARKFLNMTPMQALTGAVAGMLIGFGNLLRGGK